MVTNITARLKNALMSTGNQQSFKHILLLNILKDSSGTGQFEKKFPSIDADKFHHLLEKFLRKLFCICTVYS